MSPITILKTLNVYFLDSCFNYFDKILIHKIVFDELDNNSQKYVMEKKKSGN